MLAQTNSNAFLAPFSNETTYTVRKPALAPSPPSLPSTNSSRSSSRPSYIASSHKNRRAKTAAAALAAQPVDGDSQDEAEAHDGGHRGSRAGSGPQRLWSGLSSTLFNLTAAVTPAALSSAMASSPPSTTPRRADLFDFDSEPTPRDQRRQLVVPTAATPRTPSSARNSPSTPRNTARRPKVARPHPVAAVSSSSPQSAPATVYEQWQALEKQSRQAIGQPRSRRALGPLLIDDRKPERQLARRRVKPAEDEEEERGVEEEKQVQHAQFVATAAKPSKKTTEKEKPSKPLAEQRMEVDEVGGEPLNDGQVEDDDTSLAAKLASKRSKRPADPQSRPRPSKQRRFDVDAVPSILDTAAPAPRLSRNSQKAAVASAPSPSAVVPAAIPQPSKAATVPEANDDYCAACGHAGTLLMCAACVQAWHFGCIHSSAYCNVDDVPDDWTCTQSSRKCSSRQQPKLLTDTLSESEMAHFQWTSQPTKRREGGRRYTSFKRGDESFKLGDVVCICAEAASPPSSAAASASSADTTDRIGEIVDAWQDMYGGRLLEVRWYWLPQETKHGRLPSHHDRELFGTAHMGEVDVDTIQSKVSVLSEHDYHDREARDELDDCVYFCRRNYDHDRGDFKPLVLALDGRSQYGRGGGAERKRGRRGGGREDEGEDDDEWELDGAGGKARKQRRVIDSAASTFSRACTALQLSSLPASLPCREEEASKVRNFLTAALRRGGQLGGGLYIAGVPGTGKTATVRQVLGELARKATKDQDVLDGDHSTVPLFQFIEVNGMKLPDPSHAFTHIWQSLTGQHASPKRAMSLLDGRFRAKASRRPVCVLLLDEIDFCLTRSQQLLYALSDWPTHPHSRLVTISISNTIDFPELLHERVRSRFVGEHVTFRPYKSGQVEEIIRRRLDEVGGGGVFEKDAITLAAKKIASINGDIRVALEICRRAAIIAQQQHRSDKGGDKSECVTMRVVQRAIGELQGSSEQEMTRQCTPYQAALLAVIHCSNVAVSADAAVAVEFSGVSDRLRRAYVNRGGLLLTEDEVERMASDMVAVGLLEWVGRGKGEMNRLQVRMKMPPHLCEHALKDNVHWQQIVN